MTTGTLYHRMFIVVWPAPLTGPGFCAGFLLTSNQDRVSHIADVLRG